MFSTWVNVFFVGQYYAGATIFMTTVVALAPFAAMRPEWVAAMFDAMLPRAVDTGPLFELRNAFLRATTMMEEHYQAHPLSVLERCRLAEIHALETVPYCNVQGIALSGLRERGLVAWAGNGTDPVTLTAAGRAAIMMGLHMPAEAR